ncbi:hypothetical protein [Thauera sp. 63]|uniref:hypothetical protein n=1 Tax=Thauera sp. 63 TaxID=497321 RepID=UPI0002CFD958|nr:hypothetical protein [Thauera sp. 63]ENO79177.1 hypothetical protein C664_05581 [Thauera sp. 63]
MSRDSFNDSIIMNNMGGGSAPNIELDLEPQDVIDTEFVEQVPPKKSRKKLILALSIAGVVIGGAAALQFPQVHALLEGNNQKLDLAALSGVEAGPTTAGNPFATPEAAAPQQAVVADQLPVAPAPAAVMPDSASQQTAVAEAAPAAPQPAPVIAETAAEAELLAAAAGGEPATAEAIAPAPVQQVQQPQPASQAVTDVPVVAPVQAAVPTPALAPAPAPVATPAPVSSQPAPAPVAPIAKVAKAAEPAAVKPAVETKKVPPAEPKKASAPAPRKTETAQRTKSAEPSSKEPETVRDVMVVTASQIGLRAFTDGQLVVSTGGRDAAYRVHDLLPSGERIERIDPVAMTVITDRSVIRVKP